MQEQQQMQPSSSMLYSRPCKTMFAAFSTATFAVNHYERFEIVEERFEGEEEEH
jgi:hypothetical protein